MAYDEKQKKRIMKYLEKKCRKKYGPAILELSKELLERV